MLLTVLHGPVKKQYGPCFYSVLSGSRLFASAQYQLTNWQIRLFWPECNMEDDLCSQLRPKAEEICWFKVTFYTYDLSLMLATKIHDLSSKTATSKLTCWQRQPFFVYLSSLMGSNNLIKSNCCFKFWQKCSWMIVILLYRSADSRLWRRDARNYPWWSLWQKNTKTIVLFKPLFGRLS